MLPIKSRNIKLLNDIDSLKLDILFTKFSILINEIHKLNDKEFKEFNTRLMRAI